MLKTSYTIHLVLVFIKSLGYLKVSVISEQLIYVILVAMFTAIDEISCLWTNNIVYILC